MHGWRRHSNFKTIIYLCHITTIIRCSMTSEDNPCRGRAPFGPISVHTLSVASNGGADPSARDWLPWLKPCGRTSVPALTPAAVSAEAAAAPFHQPWRQSASLRLALSPQLFHLPGRVTPRCSLSFFLRVPCWRGEAGRRILKWAVPFPVQSACCFEGATRSVRKKNAFQSRERRDYAGMFLHVLILWD